MYGPMVPPSRIRYQSSELRQYVADEWHANLYHLILEEERLVEEERRKAKEAKAKERTSAFRNFWASGLKRLSKNPTRK